MTEHTNLRNSVNELTISRNFVKKLASGIRVAYGKEIKHTDAIELVANSLGWKADALMHKLKHDELVEIPTTEMVNLKKRPEKTKQGYEGLEVFKIFYSAVILNKEDEADEFYELINTDNAWSKLAMAFYYKNKKDDTSDQGQEYLFDAFRNNVNTIKYVSQIIGGLFKTECHFSDVVSHINSKPFIKDDEYTIFIRPDLLAWGAKIASKYGFIKNTENGLIFNVNPSINDIQIKLDNSIDKTKFIIQDKYFWSYLVYQAELKKNEKLYKNLKNMENAFIIIAKAFSRENNVNDLFKIMKPLKLVDIACNSINDLFYNNTVDRMHEMTIDDIIKNILGFSVRKNRTNMIIKSMSNKDEFIENFVSLIKFEDGEEKQEYWINRSNHLLGAIMPILYWLYHVNEIDITIPVLKRFFSLKELMNLTNLNLYPEMPHDRKNLVDYLTTIPGYEIEQGNKQSNEVLENHAYLESLLNKVLETEEIKTAFDQKEKLNIFYEHLVDTYDILIED